MDALMVPAVLAIAAANGANDNFKGVATLFGSGVASYRTAIGWGTLATWAGSLAALVVGARLTAAFTGGGLLPPEVAASPALMTAVATGAFVTVGIATRAGLPISTTHALLGALLGAGVVASAGTLNIGMLAGRFLAPLLLSPLASLALTGAAYPALSRLRRALGVEADTCVCLASVAPAPAGRHAALTVAAAPVVHACDRKYAGRVLGVDAQTLVGSAHFASAGLLSFSRGLNDTPKIAALLAGATLAGPRFDPALTIAGVALAMAAGGWFAARRVGETMSHRITTLNEGQGLASNAATASLVLAASYLALPVSMTHVAVGSIAGVGLSKGKARWSMLRLIVGSWVLTLPLAAVLGAAAFTLLERIAG
jgi:PiT family inorganic phosphate transporter